MALLQHNSVVYYHTAPSGQYIETIKGLRWRTQNETQIRVTESGLCVGSGMIGQDVSNSFFTSGSVGLMNYPVASGGSSMTAAVWTSGNANGNNVICGWGNSLGDIYDAIQVYCTTNGRPLVKYYLSNNGYQLPGTGLPTTLLNNAWDLFVWRVEWDGSKAHGYVSVNGADWSDVGTLSETKKPGYINSHLYLKWLVRDSGVTKPVPIDEAVLWKDAARFSATDLSNLYNLAYAYNRPMDEYVAQFGLPASGMLHGADVLWYQPCESGFVERVKPLGWSSSDSGDLRPGLFGSGLISTTNGNYGTLSAPSGNYIGPTGSTSWTFATWMSGDASMSPTIEAGWKSGVSDKNEIAITQASTSGFSLYLWVNGTYYAGPNFYVSPIPADKKFLVGRVEFAGSTPRFYFSLNGSPWQDGGTISAAAPSNQGTEVCLRAYQGGGAGNRAIFDESVFWLNTAKFTDNELSNLYALGNNYNATMEQYQDVMNRPPSGMIPLVVKGSILASGTLALATKGLGFATSGVSTYISGPGIQSGAKDLYVSGPGLASGMTPLCITAPTPASGTVDLTLMNWGAAGDIPLYLHNQQAIGNADLYLYGVLAATRPLFLRTYDSTVSGAVSLSVYGTSGTTAGVKTGMVDLFLANDFSPASTGCTRSMFMKASAGGTANTTTARSMFLKGGNVAKAIASLYVGGPIPVSGQARLFIWGAGDEARSNGYTPVSGQRPMFIRVRTGAIVQLPMSITGFTWPTGTCDLNIYGILGSENAVCPMALAGYNKGDGSLNLAIQGILGTASGAAPLYLEVSSTGVAGGLTALYVHGY